MLRDNCILPANRPQIKGRFRMARKDFTTVRDKFARDNGLPLTRSKLRLSDRAVSYDDVPHGRIAWASLIGPR